jgi:hypothetical protein
MKWEGCVKIHENCGGVVRWVEAIHTPGVGYYGECVGCGETEIVVEDVIPIEEVDHREVRLVAPDELESLEWDDSADWDKNQDRLSSEVSANA